MPQINLLPWREELRRRRQKEFGGLSVVAVLAMGGVVFAVHLYFQGLIGYQQARNAYLESEIVNLDKKIKEIKKSFEQTIDTISDWMRRCRPEAS